MVLFDFFFAMAIIICGYGYIVMSIFVKDTLTHILMLLGLVGFSAFFSFVVFKDKSMWSGSPDLTLSVITGFFYGHSDLLYVLCLDLFLLSDGGR